MNFFGDFREGSVNFFTLERFTMNIASDPWHQDWINLRFELLQSQGQTKRTAVAELLKIRQQKREGKKSIALRYLRAL
ncbi:hypothetical protein WN55_09838 [Dufourea novaeangliae]|uniref:Uncharacterized protein n=1 Tax=Dufourea novaeangliae TaxID=178035 RepID=A0A154P7L4_DUFNO|nr:hypothetical protein WN55_09838 [Dufourea novaeangliae]